MTPIEVAPSSQFEVGSNFATTLDLTSKADAFFLRFEQLKTNDLILQSFGVLELLTLMFMAFGFMGSASHS